ncbi:PREDICTED: immunoglobulin superfamily member 6 isoform X2 [Charadrius vociferus]|uniref:immunoglobulin superfamily member 6 isoform X2 n=1 Tax=Charadrius vociferus TaxID=50402 RepID=UPI0005216A42|nr:PREDICTED: immunoglobulin superfamily member 6 isoform X2 [Charadrius vociferus]
MASFNKLKNVLVLAFDWILYGAGAADTCQVTVTQPRFQEADPSMHTVSLTCAFSASGCSSSRPEVLWFRFLTNKHEDLCTPGCTDHQKYKVHLSENNISLQINDLTVDDNAVYICGIAFSDSSSPHSKQAGDGTILTKKEKQHSNGKLIFMIIASSLLFLYSTTVFTFFVVYKLKPNLLKKSGNEDQRTENCKISSGRKIFQAIAQELQKQRYAEHCRQPDDLEDDTVYQNR